MMTVNAKENLLQDTDDEARRLAKAIVRTARAGALALIDSENGRPLASLVGLATDIDGAPVFVMSSLSGRTKSLASDPRASLLIGAPGKGDPLAQARITMVGAARRIAEGAERARLRRRYLARHPKSKLYIDFKDFSFWRFNTETAHLVAGFGKAYALSGEDIATRLDGFETMLDSEEGAVSHMNDDHADAVNLYAVQLCGAPEGPWRLTGLDPEGIDLMSGDDARRLFFEKPLSSPDELRPMLVMLAKKARAQAVSQAEGTRE